MAEVTIYSTPTCPFCVQVKDYLKSKNVKFTDFDVAANQSKAEEMVKKTGQMGVPVTIIKKDNKEEIVVGFDKGKIDELLSLSA